MWVWRNKSLEKQLQLGLALSLLLLFGILWLTGGRFLQSMTEDYVASRLEHVRVARISPFDDAAFSPTATCERLQDHLGVASLEGFGCDGLPLAIAAAGGVLAYLQQNQISDLAHIVRLTTYDLTAYLSLDAITRAYEALAYRNVDGEVGLEPLKRRVRKFRIPGEGRAFRPAWLESAG